MDREKLGELYDKYITGLIYFINGYVHNEAQAEDLAEDVFVELLLHPDRFKKASSEKTYLYAIGKNKAIDFIRKESRSFSSDAMEELGDWEFDYQEDVLSEVVRNEQSRELKQAISELNENYRMAIYLSYFEGMSNSEIADVMKVSKKQVENYLYRGKSELKGFEI